MSPTHHPPQEELLEYAAGVTPEWLSLMLACHLTLCRQCREELSTLEALGGAILEQAPTKPVAPPRTRRPAPRAAAPTPHRGIARLPEPLGSRVPRPLHPYVEPESPDWLPLQEGIEYIPLSLEVNSHPVRLLRLLPDHLVRSHEHGGLEWFMVLEGSIDDSLTGRHYYRGDVCRNERGTIHHQRVANNEPCIAIVARTGPFVPRPDLAP